MNTAYRSPKKADNILIEKVKRDINSEPQSMHFHPFYEMGYLLSGRRQMFINHSVYSMEKGDIILVDMEAVHKSASIQDKNECIEWIGVYFAKEYVEPFMEAVGKETMSECFSTGVIRIPNNRRAYVEEIFSRMLYEYGRKDEISGVLLKCYFGELMGYILRHRESENNDLPQINPDDELIVSAAKYIYDNYMNDIRLSEIAGLLNMSKSYFSKRFKAVTGCGFKEYLINVRLKEACRLLLDTDKSITDIAYLCGFSDSNYFGDAFKRVKGVSPKDYRKNC